MSTSPLRSVTPAIDIYIKLAQYPILADEIRQRMREELFQRGIVSKADFEAEVKHKAVESQRREGLHDPFGQEETNVWQRRKDRVRDFQTDAYFANNLGIGLLEQIIEQVLLDQPAPSGSIELTFNPEIAPWDLLFKQGEIYEGMPPREQEQVSHHLEEIKVVLIKGMISDHLPFIGVAKNVFSMADLRHIFERRIGRGKIGGKAAGMTLAWKILQQSDPEFGPDVSDSVGIPDSYFIGTEVIYDFRLANDMDRFMNQKYRPLEEIRREYPTIVEAHLQGAFPEEIVDQLREVLDQVGKSPLIVRSSSLLEDNFGYSFAGKYESYFCPNQAGDRENLAALLDAIRRVYASTVNPDAILYRKHHGLLDYDERMAILLQRLQGQQYKNYFLPALAGVGFSQNPYRWNPKIRREDGFLRLVWGIGTRAVDRVDHDYPRLMALSHPELRPETSAKAVRQYSQSHVDILDLVENRFKTLAVRELLQADYPFLRQIASVDKGDYLQEILSPGFTDPSAKYVLTFSSLSKDRKFVKLMRTALMRLERAYGTPVDIEFTVQVVPGQPYPDYRLHILQCRPLSQRTDEDSVTIPEDIPEEDVLFRGDKLVPDGRADSIRYIVFVDPEKYHLIPERSIKLELGRAIGRLNSLFETEEYVLMGPGRWGSVNLDLGVPISYADIYNTRVLIEIAIATDGRMSELSYGTHFFQDLVESGIYSLPLQVRPDDQKFNWPFFRESPSCLASMLPEDASLEPYLRVIDLAATPSNCRLRILMDGTRDEAVGYLVGGAGRVNEGPDGSISTF
jgi:hypothetical protein